MNNINKLVAGFFFIWDTVILGITFLVSLYIFKDTSVQGLDWMLFMGLISIWLVIVKWRKLYFFDVNGDLSNRILNYVKSSAILVVILGLAYLIFTFPPTFRKVVLSFSIGFPLIGIVTNFVILSIINRLKNSGGVGKNVLVTGQGEMVNKVNSYFKENPKNGYQVKGVVKYQNVAEPELAIEGGEYVSDLESMGSYIKENPVDEVIVALPIQYSEEIKKILNTADYYGTRVRFVPDYQNLLGEDCKVIRQGKMDMVNVRQMPLDDKISAFIKECFDWCFSSLVLLMLSPLFFLIVLLIKLDRKSVV